MSKPNNDVKWGFKHEGSISYYNKNTMKEIDRSYKSFLIDKSNCVKIVFHIIEHGKNKGQTINHFIYFNNMNIICEDDTFELIKA